MPCTGFHLGTFTCKGLHTFRWTRDSAAPSFLPQVQAFRSNPLPLTQPYVLQNKTNLSLPASFYIGQSLMISKSLYYAFFLTLPALRDLLRATLAQRSASCNASVTHFLEQSGPPLRTHSISHGGWSTLLIPCVFSYWG